MFSQFIGVATNSTHVTHEVLARVVSEGLVLKELKNLEKFVKKFVSASNKRHLSRDSPLPWEMGGTVSRYSNRTETLL